MTEAAGTLVLARRDIAALMDLPDWFAAVEEGFRAAGDGRAQVPAPWHIEGEGGAFHAKGARLKCSPEKRGSVSRRATMSSQGSLDRLYVALKLNANFPGNPAARGMPTIQGGLLLCDGETGALLAIMDSIEITLRRTAAASALAARHLARPDATTILVCGCGEQAAPQLAALCAVLSLRRLIAWDSDRGRAEALVRRARGLEASVAADLTSAARGSDVILTCTTSRTPFLEPEMVSPGTFVAAVGADSPDKSEIAPALMAEATVVADLVDQCAVMGDLHHALAAGAMRREHVHAELSELVSAAKSGRTSQDQITLFDSTGTALQDVAAAAWIYERGRGDAGLIRVDLAE